MQVTRLSITHYNNVEASKLKKSKSKTTSVFFILNLWNGKNFDPQATELIRKDVCSVQMFETIIDKDSFS